MTLAPQDDRQQTEPVIAIGSPNGDTNSLIYGNITAISGKLTIPDAEYTPVSYTHLDVYKRQGKVDGKVRVGH